MKKRKIIDKIRVGNRVYKLKGAQVSNDFEGYDEEGLYRGNRPSLGVLGQHCGELKTIWVKKTALSKNEQKQVLFHEIAHALFSQMKRIDRRYFGFKPMAILNNDETFIDDFSKVLMKTFEIKSLINTKNEKTKK